MLPLLDRLFKETRLKVKRHLVWEETPNFLLMQMYDAKTKCRWVSSIIFCLVRVPLVLG